MALQRKEEIAQFYKTVGKNIHDFRVRNDISQEVLAKHLGFKSRISIANIENAKQNIQLHTLFQIAAYLKVSVVDLLPKPIEKEISKNVRKKIEKNFDPNVSAEKIIDFIKLVTANK